MGYAAVTSKPQHLDKTTQVSRSLSATCFRQIDREVSFVSHSKSQAYKAVTNCHPAGKKESALEVLALEIKYFDPIVMHITH